MAESVARQRVASAQAASASLAGIRVLLPPFPCSRVGPRLGGHPLRRLANNDATSSNRQDDRAVDPENAGSTPAVAAQAPVLLADRGISPGLFKPATRVRIPLGASASRPATARKAGGWCTRFPSALGRVWRMRPGCLPGEAGSIPVESAPLAVAQWTSTTLLPWPTGVRLLPARLRRKASSEPSGRDPVEQGAIPWRRPNRSTTPAGAGAALIRRQSAGSTPRSIDRLAVGETGPPRRFREPETAGSTPADQICRRAVEERLSSRAS